MFQEEGDSGICLNLSSGHVKNNIEKLKGTKINRRDRLKQCREKRRSKDLAQTLTASPTAVTDENNATQISADELPSFSVKKKAQGDIKKSESFSSSSKNKFSSLF